MEMDKKEIATGSGAWPFYPERYDGAIVVVALLFYIVERYALFAILLQRPENGLESQILGFLYGRPPFSIRNILLGFDSNQGMFGLIMPNNLVAVVLQSGHFLLNYLIVRFPFSLIEKLQKRKTNP